MSILVEQQDETINVIQETAANVETDVETGYVSACHTQGLAYGRAHSLGYTEKAVVSARAARKKRWICFGIVVVIIIIVVVVVVIEVSFSSDR